MALGFDLSKTLDDIRKAIANALGCKQDADVLTQRLQEQLEQLHRAVRLPEQSPDKALFRFATDYIQAAPDNIEATFALANEAKISAYTDHFIATICEHFQSPPTIAEQHSGLCLLLDQAYLTHRILEEVNDQIASLSGQALTPVDMAHASLITHSVLGESFANQLDHLVLLAVELSPVDVDLFQQADFVTYQAKRKQHGWQGVFDSWPRLQNDLAIELQFGQTLSIDLSDSSH